MKQKVKSNKISNKKLRVSKDKKWLGVCGGIASYVNIDPAAIRVLFIVITFLSGVFPGLLIYILAAWVMSETE
jgi:phage shock protein C